MNIVVYIFLIIWTVSFVYIGIPDLFMMLGGSAIFYLLLPLIAFIYPKNKALTKLLWSIVLTLFGLMLTNYSYSYFLCNYKDFRVLTRIYVVLIPALCILMGYGLTMETLLITPMKARLERKEHAEALGYFCAFFMGVFVPPLFCLIPFLVQFHELRNINSIGYEIALGGLIVGGLIFLFEARRIPIETLMYFTRPLPRFDTDTRKLRKRLMIGILICVVWSAIKELLYRQQWIIWGETVVIFVMYVLLLNNFSRVLFLPASFPSASPSKIWLPSIKNKRGRAIVGLLFLALFVFVFIAVTRTPHFPK